MASRKKDEHVEAPLHPTTRWQAMCLFGKRFVRCLAVALVPMAGFLALPKILALHRNGAQCLKPSLQRESWRACYAQQGWRQSDLLHYLLAIWFSLQFLYNFIMSCFQQPGGPPKTTPKDGRFPVIIGAEHQIDGIDGPLFFAPRWCEKCSRWKAPRSHHSKRLGQCVPRMDHYCIITENIIGQRNQSYFNLMVIFGNLGLLYALLMIASTMCLAWRPYWELFSLLANYARRKGNYFQWIFLGGHLHVMKALLGNEVPLLLVLSIFSMILLGPLLRHLSLSLQGITTLESMGSSDSIELPGSSKANKAPARESMSCWMLELFSKMTFVSGF
eukprot:s3239_g13.t1